jgi:hypothetical protein
LTFGTLLSSQGTDASFETVSPVPSGRFVRVSILSDHFRGPFRLEFRLPYAGKTEHRCNGIASGNSSDLTNEPQSLGRGGQGSNVQGRAGRSKSVCGRPRTTVSVAGRVTRMT